MATAILKPSFGFSFVCLFVSVGIIGDWYKWGSLYCFGLLIVPVLLAAIFPLLLWAFSRFVSWAKSRLGHAKEEKELSWGDALTQKFERWFNGIVMIFAIFCSIWGVKEFSGASRFVNHVAYAYMFICYMTALLNKASTLKIYLLSIIFTPIVGYAASCLYDYEQEQAQIATKSHLESAQRYFGQKDYANAVLECKAGLAGIINCSGYDFFREIDKTTEEQKKVYYELYCVLAETYCEQEQYFEAAYVYFDAQFLASNAWDSYKCVFPFGYSEELIKHESDCVKRSLSIFERYYPNYSVLEKKIHMNLVEAEMDLKRRRYDDALSEYGKALELDPNNAEAYVGRAKVYTEREEFDNALADYAKAIKLDPAKSRAFEERAKMYLKQGNSAQALADYEQAITFCSIAGDDNKKADTYISRANVYIEQGEYASAIADYTEAIRLHGYEHSLYVAYVARAEIYAEQKEYDSAFADYTAAIALDSKEASTYVARAKICIAQKDYISAIADCQRAIEIAPDYREAHGTLADGYARQGKYAEAVSGYTQAIQWLILFDADDLDNELGEIYRKRGEMHQKLGNEEQASADFAKSKKLSVSTSTEALTYFLRENPKDEKREVEISEAVRTCANCGATLKDESNFCSKCGTSVNEAVDVNA